MGFNIPMNSTGAMNAGSLMGLMGGNNNQSVGGTNQPVSNMNQPVGDMNQPVGGQNQAMMQDNQYGGVQPQQQVVRQRPQATGVSLKKGQKHSLVANGQPMSRIQVCLGWDLVNQACDLDASAFMLGANNRIVGDDWFVFYGQPVSPDGSVTHSGDSTGEGAGDDEIITINLQQVNQQVQKIVFVVTIDRALELGQNFSMVANAYVRVVDANTGIENARFNLSDYYANVTSMIVGEVYNHNGQWKFNPVGDGVARDLAGLCEMYGVNVVD